MLAHATGSDLPMGKSPKPAQNTINTTMPNQKVGMLAPLTDNTRVIWSAQRSRLVAANVPSDIPRPIATRLAVTASSAVAASFSGKTFATGADSTPDHPSSPRTTPASHDTYWRGSGSSGFKRFP